MKLTKKECYPYKQKFGIKYHSLVTMLKTIGVQLDEEKVPVVQEASAPAIKQRDAEV